MLALPFPAAPAAQQFAELGRRHLPPEVESTRAVVLGDVDRDDDLDLVAGDASQDHLYLNDGTGIFRAAPSARLPVHGETTSLVLGDVDGDGDLDLVAGKWGQDRLYLNDGTGTFTDAPARLPLENGQELDSSLVDVDGDRDLDLVLVHGDPLGWRVRLYLNDGAGTFTDGTTARIPPSSARARALAVGDVDRDGDADLVVGNAGGQNRLFLNDGAGSFTDATAARLPVDNDYTEAVALGDVDRDGDLDLVAGNGGDLQHNRLYLNDGAGTFTEAPGRLPVYRGYAVDLVFVDVDQDGDVDLLEGNTGNQQNRLYRNDGAGTFTDVTALLPVVADRTTDLAAGDVDGDGDLDLVVGNDGQQNRLHLNDGAGRFRDAAALRIPSAAHDAAALALGDVDRDGDLDLVAGSDGENCLYRNDGDGSFPDATARRLLDYGFTTSLALGDVDGDGDLDLVAGKGRSVNLMQNRLYLNDGTGTFTDVTTARMPQDDGDSTTALALGDVDGDGDLDLVVGNEESWSSPLRNRLYRNDGSGTFTDATAALGAILGDHTRCLALGDVDRDGDLDLVVGNFRQQSRLYLNDGAGTFTEATAARLPVRADDTTALALGDVDHDGDLDLAVGNMSGQQNRLYLNDGAGTFRDATAARLPLDGDDTRAIALGDVDDDGDLDLIAGNGSGPGQQNRLYVNDGTGTFTDATLSHMPAAASRTTTLALGDVDGDGDLDVLVGNDGLHTRLLLGLVRQIDAPYLLRARHTWRLDAYARLRPTAGQDVAFPYLAPARGRFPLPPFGTLWIDPASMVALPPVPVPQPAGVGSLLLPIPDLRELEGAAVHTQALLLQQPVRARLTNVVSEVFRR